MLREPRALKGTMPKLHKPKKSYRYYLSVSFKEHDKVGKTFTGFEITTGHNFSTFRRWHNIEKDIRAKLLENGWNPIQNGVVILSCFELK